MNSDQFSNFFNSTTRAWPEDSLPVVTFNDRVTLHMNGETVFVLLVPRGHTDGDSIVYFQLSNVVLMGDILFSDRYPFIDLDGGGSIQGTISGVKTGMSLGDAKTRFIAGHGPIIDRKGMQKYLAFLIKARDNVQALIDQGMSLPQAVAAKPTAQWDETLGRIWITPEQMVIFIYNSLTGVDQFTPLKSQETE